MRNGDVFTIHLVGMSGRMKRLTRRIDVGDQLMPKEIEVDPFPVGPSLRTAEECAIKLSGGR